MCLNKKAPIRQMKALFNLLMDIIIVIIYMTFKILINKMLVKQNTIKVFLH